MNRLSRASIVPVRVDIGDVAVAPLTTQLTDLGALVETALGDDLAGARISSVRGQGSVIGTVGGLQTYAYALFVGPNLLDAADVFPATVPSGITWWTWHNYIHRGQQHNVLAAAAEFTEHSRTMTTRGIRRIPDSGSTLWFAQETSGQTQNAAWRLTIRLDRS